LEAAEPGRLSAGAGAAAQRLRVDYATAAVLRAFESARVRSILLKGPSLARWLYEPGDHRTYLDCDLLVPDEDFEAAAATLPALGYAPEVEEGAMPAWWREHGVTWFRDGDPAAIDLHRSLPGVHVDAATLWRCLAARTEPVEVGGFAGATLTVPGRALHLALHVAQHGGVPRHVMELERALERADEQNWREAAELAYELDATAAMGIGLRFSPEGAALADRLGLPTDVPVEVALRAERVPEALTVERFSQAPWGARAAILRHKLAPPATFMRKWSRLARRGRLGLALAYLWRPLWILGRAPGAVRAWLAARRR
jgi:hypothetical protein